MKNKLKPYLLKLESTIELEIKNTLYYNKDIAIQWDTRKACSKS